MDVRYCAPETVQDAGGVLMLHKLSLLMTGLVLMMGVAWFGIEYLTASDASAQTVAANDIS